MPSSAKVGKKFVDFPMVNTVTGNKAKLKDVAGQGKPTVVLVYSSETVDSGPALQMFEEYAFANAHVEFVAFNVEDDIATTRKFIQEQAIRKCLCFNGKLPKGYGIEEGRLPFHIVISEEGKLLQFGEDTLSTYIDLVK